MASKKDIIGAGAASANVFNTIAKGGTQDTQDTQDTKTDSKIKMDPLPETAEVNKYYRFNLKMPKEYKDYLKAAAYKSSTPQKSVTITEYICDLIKQDMEKNAGKD